MHPKLEVVQSDLIRDEVREFLHRMLGDRSGLQIPTTAEEQLVGMSSLILTIRWQGQLQGALFASADVETARDFQHLGHWKAARAIGQRVAVIHQVAVVPGFRRLGLARELVATAIRLARQSGAWVVTLNFDSTNDGLVDFYSAAGFTCFDPGEMLGLKLRSVRRMIGLPLDNPVDAWAVHVINPTRVRVRQVSPRQQRTRTPGRRHEHASEIDFFSHDGRSA